MDNLLAILGFTEGGASPTQTGNLKRGVGEYANDGTENVLYEERVTTLVRKKGVRRLNVDLEKPNDILNLKYRLRAPSASGLGLLDEYSIKKKVESFIRSEFKKFECKDELAKRGVPFIGDLIGVYSKYLAISVPKNSLGGSMAESLGKSKQSLEFYVPSLNFRFHGTVNAKRRVKNGYYHYRSGDRDCRYIVDSPSFLYVVSILNRIFQLVMDLRASMGEDDLVFRQAEGFLESLFEVNWSIGGAILEEDFKDRLLQRGYGLNMDSLTYEKEGNLKTVSYDELVNPKGSMRHLYAIYELLYKEVPIPLEAFFNDFGTGSVYFCMVPTLFGFCVQLFSFSLSVLADYRAEESHRKRLVGSVATAYVTKKNIPRKVMESMKASSFNQVFGFVEFDEEVDLDAVKRIEDECIRLNRVVFGNRTFKDVTLRLRKLGKHKAIGLYFPSLNTLCVDIRHPSSFVHEYFHMLDDQFGGLSLQHRFHPIVEEYKSAVLASFESLDPAVKKALKGSGKYNLNYYFLRSEIFARCGEMYLNRFLGMESSLLRQEAGKEFAYPKGETLGDLVKGYYGDLLKGLPKLAA